MSDMPRVKCPEYVSGACLGQGCDGFLQDVAFAGLAQDGRNQYSGTCRRGGRWEHFTGLFAEPAPSKVRPGLSAYDGRRKAMPTVGRGVPGVPQKRGVSRTPRWTQKDAAEMIGISTRQLRSYKSRPPDQDWPGWEDPVNLKTWLNSRESAARMSRAIKNHLPLREGGVTERDMAGSKVPARRA